MTVIFPWVDFSFSAGNFSFYLLWARRGGVLFAFMPAVWYSVFWLFLLHFPSQATHAGDCGENYVVGELETIKLWN